LRWDGATATWSIVGTADEVRQSTKRREIVDVLEGHGPLAPKEIAELLKKERGAVRRLLKKMLRAGELHIDGTLYTPGNSGNRGNSGHSGHRGKNTYITGGPSGSIEALDGSAVPPVTAVTAVTPVTDDETPSAQDEAPLWEEFSRGTPTTLVPGLEQAKG
jgi:hypothetical protein